MKAQTLAVFLAICVPGGSISAADVELLASHPRNGATDVSVSASIHLRFSDPLDAATLDHLVLSRIEPDGSRVAVEVQSATDLTHASITLSPREFLQPDTKYAVTSDRSLLSEQGTPVATLRLEFQTGSAASRIADRLVFEPVTVERIRSLTTVVIGPDRRLYGADAFGNLYRWELDSDGTPVRRETIWEDQRRSRQIIDLEWDPAASADRLILWVSYAERLPPDESRRFFTGTISRLTIGKSVREQKYVIGLPHGRERQGGFDTLPHQPNGLVFRNGLLYQSIGSTSSSGGPPNWGLPEQRLSACVVEIDTERIDPPLDVHPDTGYDATAADAPLRLFATGIRNALELVAHPNGRLYTGVNQNDRRGPADGVPDHPNLPGNQNLLVTSTTPDHESLIIVERGRHYGFPNPSRKQYVLAGGNPTPESDPFEIPEYPVGTPPDEGFAPELMYPVCQFGGTSPDGGLVYDRPGHPLDGQLIWCFYSAGDIAVMPLGEAGRVVIVEKLRTPSGKLLLSGPLDITQDQRTGILYLACFGKQNLFGADGSLVMLRPGR